MNITVPTSDVNFELKNFIDQGAVAVFTLIDRITGRCIVLNLGDSRAVFLKNGDQNIMLTKDSTFKDEAEKKRCTDHGFFGFGRCAGLTPASAFGDFYLKRLDSTGINSLQDIDINNLHLREKIYTVSITPQVESFIIGNDA